MNSANSSLSTEVSRCYFLEKHKRRAPKEGRGDDGCRVVMDGTIRLCRSIYQLLFFLNPSLSFFFLSLLRGFPRFWLKPKTYSMVARLRYVFKNKDSYESKFTHPASLDVFWEFPHLLPYTIRGSKAPPC